MQKAWWTDWDLFAPDDVYGPMLGGHSVQEAVYNTLQTWLSTYIAEFNRKVGSTVLFDPIEYRHRPDYRTLPKNAGAAILVTVPGTFGQPEVYSDSVRAEWKVEIMVFVYGTKDWQETEALTHAYTTVVRAAILQHRDLMGFATGTTWESEQYLEGEHSSTRTTGVGHIVFGVVVGNVINVHDGLPMPDYAATGVNTDPTTRPPSPRVEATSVKTTLAKEPL